VELDAIRQEIATSAAGRLTALTLEGEPGIGKTRLLLTACELATESGCTAIAVTADEELRGPFVLARSIVGAPAALAAAREPETLAALTRCLDAMSGKDDPALASLPAEARLLRTFDLASVALRALATEAPLVILIDDLQWADDDSVRMIRYVIRAFGAGPLLLVFALRPSELALATEAVNLIADLDRIGLIRRIKLGRFTSAETGDLARGKPLNAIRRDSVGEQEPIAVEDSGHHSSRLNVDRGFDHRGDAGHDGACVGGNPGQSERRRGSWLPQLSRPRSRQVQWP